jgi:hypothetical protein
MAPFAKFNSFVYMIATGGHNLTTDQLRVAFCSAANTPVSTNSLLSNLTTNLWVGLGGSTSNVSTTGSNQAAGLYKLVVADWVGTAQSAVAPFQYVVIYNASRANSPLVGWYDYGGTVSMVTGDTFTIDFDQANGLLTIQ